MKRKRKKSASRLTLADKKVIEAIVVRVIYKRDRRGKTMSQKELECWFEDVARRVVESIESTVQYWLDNVLYRYKGSKLFWFGKIGRDFI